MIDRYTWSGGSEAMLRFGPDHGPVVVAALPLFEEANRTRAFVVTILRELAKRGIAGALPDLPGTGDSIADVSELRMPFNLIDAFACATDKILREGRECHAVGIRSGTLIDKIANVGKRWHFAPQNGDALFRELRRVGTIPSDIPPHAIPKTILSNSTAVEVAPGPPVEIAGNRISRSFLAGIPGWEPTTDCRLAPVRVVRLEDDRRRADAHVAGTPLWRRIEPGNDPVLAALLADDIANWVRECES